MNILRYFKYVNSINADDDSEMTKLNSNLLKYSLQLIKLIGVTKQLTNYLTVFVVTISVATLFLGSVWFALQNKNDLSDTIEPILCAFFIAPCYLKLVVIIYKKNKLFEFVDCIESVWKESEHEEFEYILIKTERRCRMFIIWYVTTFYFMVATITIGPVLYYIAQKYILDNPDAQLTMMVRVDFKLEMDNYIAYLLTTIIAWIAVLLILCMDSLFPPLALHTAAIFQLLDKRLTNIMNVTMDSGNINELRLREKLFKTKTSFIKLQANAFKCINLLEDIFNIPILIQISFSSLKICVVLWRISVVGGSNYTSSDPSSMWVIFIGDLISELFVNLLYCYCGQNFDNEAAKVTETLYKMKWYEIKDNNFRKMIQMLLQRSQTPVVVTAGKFYVIKLETYIKILKGAYAYYTFMRRAAG